MDTGCFNYSNLGVYRKIYLALVCISTLFLSAVLISSFVNEGLYEYSFLYLSAFLIGRAIWLCVAVSRRSVQQIYVLTLLFIFNPLAALLILGIAIVSKRENKEADEQAEVYCQL